MNTKTLLATVCALATVATLAACAPQARDGSAEGSSDASTPAVQVSWSADSDCSVCHKNPQSSYENASCLASKHVEQKCIDCHVDETALESVHDGVSADDKQPKRLKKTDVTDESCLSCHYGTKEKLVEATSDLLVTDDNGTSANPHDLPENPDHETLACENCHGMHDEASIAEQAQATCLSCHHAGVFECYTCHE